MMEIAISSGPVPYKDRWIVQVSKTADSSHSILRIFKPARVICVRYRHITLPLEAWGP